VPTACRPSEAPRVKGFLKNRCVNWVTSDTAVDTRLKERASSGCPILSAGHTRHEFTTASARASVFNFLQERVDRANAAAAAAVK
jgi:hypothetical protein